MQKKLQLLKWAVRLSALLLIGIASLGGTLPITQADGTPTSSCRFFYTATPSTTFTPPNTKYDASALSDQGLKDSLTKQFELHCDAPQGTCTLVSGTGNTTLDKSNLSASKYYSDGLANYNLNCTAGTTQGTLVQGDTCHLSLVQANGSPLEPGNVKTLDTSLVPDDNGLNGMLKGATLTCNNGPYTTCQLSTTGATTLDLSNFGTSSSYFTNGNGIPGFSGLKDYKLICQK